MAIKWVNKDHVNASDSTTYANNDENNPWLTPLRGLWGNTNRDGAATPSEAVTAGDTLRIVKPADGFYEFSRGAHDESEGPTLIPCNSGSDGSPIIIEAFGLNGEFGEDFIELVPDASSDGDVFGGFDDSVGVPGDLSMGYFEWRGFKAGIGVDANSGSWPCFFQGVHHCLVEYCYFDGGAGTGVNDNHNATRTVFCNDIIIRNNYFTGFFALAAGDENGNALEVYDSGGIIFENNYVTNCGCGVFYKAPNTSANPNSQQWDIAPHIVRFNHFHDCTQGPAVHRISQVAEANGTYIYQNLITQMRGTCVRFKTFNATELSPQHTKFFNNTIWSNEGAQPEFEIFAGDDIVFADNMNIVVKNNVVKVANNIPGLFCADTLASLTSNTNRVAFERNAYDTPSASAGTFFSGGSTASYASWIASGVQDPNSVVGTVTFTAGSPDPANPLDFRLASNGQDALTLGRVIFSIGGTNGDTIPVGCYITGDETIGITPFADGGEEPSAGIRIYRVFGAI